MTIAVTNPKANPGDAFQSVLETIRADIPEQSEVAQVRNLISETSIRLLNRTASSHYDDNHSVVRFYGGMIHRYPEAEFTVKNTKSKTRPTARRELGDLLVVVVFLDLDGSGKQVHRRSRACIIQAKTSKASRGPKMFNFDPTIEDTPKTTRHEQFYLLNQFPPFTLVGEGSKLYDLRSLDTSKKPLAKYCFIWNGTGAKAPSSSWRSSWQCAPPTRSASANYPLGNLLADLISSQPQAGLDFFPAAGNDWEALMTQLTTHCSTNDWGSKSKLADPAGVSFVDRIAAFSTLQQYSRGYEGYPEWPYWEGPPSSSWPDLSGLKGMPVLIASMASFDKGDHYELISPDARRSLISQAARVLRS